MLLFHFSLILFKYICQQSNNYELSTQIIMMKINTRARIHHIFTEFELKVTTPKSDLTEVVKFSFIKLCMSECVCSMALSF